MVSFIHVSRKYLIRHTKNMINPIKFIKRIYYRIKNLDPILKCPVYKKEGCSHVDGPYCDFPDCSILHEHMGDKWVFCLECIDEPDCIHGGYGFGCYNGKRQKDL